jgi:AhpD family alkylhydroperoxidase
MESQVKLDEERVGLLEKFKQNLPETYAAESGVIAAVYKDGALSVRVKRLMALAIALRLGCTNCILGQTKLALEQGATREEILETISVNVAMSGTTGYAEALRVLKLLDELGIL